MVETRRGAYLRLSVLCASMGCMEERQTLLTMAKRYGTEWHEVFKVARELKINVVRMDARLNKRQTERLHAYFKNQEMNAAIRRKRAAGSSSRLVDQGDAVHRQAKTTPAHDWTKQCECCDWRFVYRAPEDSYQPFCSACAQHRPKRGEPVEQTLQRARDHEKQFRTLLGRYAEAADDSHREKQRAFDSRMKWSRALAEVVLDHDKDETGNCWCGMEYPCRTWRKLEEANRGILKQVEIWGSMSDDRREEALYGDDHRHMLDREDIEIQRRAQAMADARVGNVKELAYPPAPEKALPAMPRSTKPA